MKKPIYKKWWFWLCVVVVLSVGMGTTEVKEEVQSNEVVATEPISSVAETVEPEVVVVEPTVEPEVEEVIEEVPLTYGVGDTATAKSYTLTVESLEVIESDNQFSQPDEGYEYVEIVLLLENISDSELNISSWLNFDAYADGFSINEDISANVASTYETMNGTVASGKKLKGSLCYSVPEDWSELEITVDIGYSTKNELTLLFQN